MENSPNRVYKDSVFSLYMSEPARLIEVYNAIQGTNYPLDTPVEINTLDDVLYKERINDISFLLDGKYVVLIEHQSTINENMPLRMLLYLGRLYEKFLDRDNIYRRKRISLPAPEFLMLYNGREPYPEESVLRLSDAFLAKPHENSAELLVKVLNVRYQPGKAVLQRSKSLYDYSVFIDRVEQNRKSMELDEAIREAVLYCEKHNIMQPFLITHASEVENMLTTEWNWEDARRIWKEEDREDFLEEGRMEGRDEERRTIAKNLLEFMPKEQVTKALKMTDKQLQELLKS